MNNVLVTGGAGFIGSNLVRRLLEDDKTHVIVVDNLHSGSLDNLKDLNIEFVDSGKRGVAIISNLYSKRLHQIYHLGIYSSTPMYRANRRLAAKALVDFIDILEFAKENNCKVVFASSSSIYNGNVPPFHENMTIYATDFYTEVRYHMERIAQVYSEFYGLKYVALRPFSVYGPHETTKGQYANNITQFLWSMKKGEIPVIYGDGNQARDFTYVSDVVDAFILAMEKDVTGIFNVGTGIATSFNQIIDILNAKLGTGIPRTYVPNPLKNYVKETRADTTKAKVELGFEAKIGLDEGINRLIDFYR